MHRAIYTSLATCIALAFLAPIQAFGWEPTQEDKILSKVTKTAILKDYYIEEIQEVPSSSTFVINGKEISLVADAEDIEKWLKNRKGKKFQITYAKVRGPIGDMASDEYEVLIQAKLLK